MTCRLRSRTVRPQWIRGTVAGAGSDLDELEELAERINKTSRTSATTVRGDPLPDWLQPFNENLAKNEGDEQKKHEQQAAAPFAPASVAGAPTTPDDDDELVVDEEVIKEHDPDEQHGDRKIIKVHDPPCSLRRRRYDSTCCAISRIEVGVTIASEGEDESVTIEDSLKITLRGSRSTTWTIAFPGTSSVNG